MKNWLKSIDRGFIIYGLLISALLLFLLGSIKITNVAFIAMIVVWLIDPKISIKLKSAFSNRIVLLFISYFILGLIGLLYSSDLKSGFKFIEMRVLIFFFPLILGTTQQSIKHFHSILKVFVFGCLSILIIGLCNAALRFHSTGDSGFFFNDSLIDFVSIQAAYFAIYTNLCIVICVYFFNQVKSNVRYWFILLVALFGLFELLLATRISILTMLLIAFIYILFILIKGDLKKAVFVGVASAFIIVIGYFSFPQTVNRFESMLSNFKYDYSNLNPVNHFNAEVEAYNWNGLTLRLALWNCGIDIIKESPIFGVGTGDYDSEFRKTIEKKNFIYAIQQDFGVHNQYLYTWISFGIVGLLLFISSLLFPFFYALKNSNYLFVVFIIIISIAFLTENVLNRYHGIVLFSVFNSLLFFQPFDKVDKGLKEA